MESISWLQYIANPYSLIAVIAAILGFSFLAVIRKFEKPKPGFIVGMYAMFLTSILALGLGGLAIYFFLSGEGAKDLVIETHARNFSLFSAVYAQEEKEQNTGWVWAGEIEKPKSEIEEARLQIQMRAQVVSQTLEIEEIPRQDNVVQTKCKANLRKNPPKFSWWRFRFVLGDLIEVLPQGTKLEVLEKKRAGWELWMKVKVLEE